MNFEVNDGMQPLGRVVVTTGISIVQAISKWEQGLPSRGLLTNNTSLDFYIIVCDDSNCCWCFFDTKESVESIWESSGKYRVRWLPHIY